MKGSLITLRADGGRAVKTFDRPVQLSELQRAVGGYIEEIPRFDRWDGQPCAAFCNDEGKLKGLRLNHDATTVWRTLNPATSDVLVGDVVVVIGDDEFLEAL